MNFKFRTNLRTPTLLRPVCRAKFLAL